MQIIKIGYRFVLCISILHFTCVFGQKDTVDADVRSERETHKTEVKILKENSNNPSRKQDPRSGSIKHQSRQQINNVNTNTKNPLLRQKEMNNGITSSTRESETARHINDYRNTKSIFSSNNIFDRDSDDEDEVGIMTNEDDHTTSSPAFGYGMYNLSLFILQFGIILILINPALGLIVLLAWMIVFFYPVYDYDYFYNYNYNYNYNYYYYPTTEPTLDPTWEPTWQPTWEPTWQPTTWFPTTTPFPTWMPTTSPFPTWTISNAPSE